MLQEGKMILNNINFELKQGTNNKFYIFDSIENIGTVRIGFDIDFESNEYETMKVSPSISINEFETGMTKIEEIIGHTFKINSMAEADEREDLFYFYEHEPLVKYEFSIIDILKSKIHLLMKGVAIIDGYATPYKMADFYIDCWLDIVY